jgi:hypothetical protein
MGLFGREKRAAGAPGGVHVGEHAKEVREHLQILLEDSAEWRARRAEEYPDDTYNARCAVALALAADDLAALPAKDPRLLHLAQFFEEGDDDAIRDYNDEESRIISRHGVDGPEPRTDRLLDALVTAADDAALRTTGGAPGAAE